MTPKIEDVQITVHASNLVGEVISYGTESTTEDLQRMIYRQRTLELLFIANQKMNRDEIVSLKKEMKEFMKEMKEYMKEIKELNDPLIKNLCDDIVITYRTLGTQFGPMYSSSRQTTQGEERLHNVSDTPIGDELSQNVSPRFGPKKAFKPFVLDELYEDDDIMDSHNVSIDTPYYSGRVATLMRSVTEENVDEEEPN
jgi:predicted CopG family antitoxin